MQVSQSAKLSQPQANKSSSGTPERYRCVADRQMRNRWPPVQACPTYSFARRGILVLPQDTGKTQVICPGDEGSGDAEPNENQNEDRGDDVGDHS